MAFECGTGKECERVCPLMKQGRECPSMSDFFRACEVAAVSPFLVLLRGPALA